MTERSRIMLVGRDPAGPVTDESPPPLCGGSTGRRLSELTGVPVERLPEVFHLTNLFPVHMPGTLTPRDRRIAMENAQDIRADISQLDERAVVLLGRDVQEAFGFYRKRPLTRIRTCSLPLTPVTYVIMPHPSGLTRYWNEPAHVRAAQRHFSDLMREFGA